MSMDEITKLIKNYFDLDKRVSFKIYPFISYQSSGETTLAVDIAVSGHTIYGASIDTKFDNNVSVNQLNKTILSVINLLSIMKEK